MTAPFIYVKDVTLLKTGFAHDTYGIGYAEPISDMSQRVRSVLAVNGDSYSNNRHKNNGTMKIYSPDAFDAEQVIEQGAWQSWVFGPGLLDEAGNSKKDFLTWDYIRESHPRTAIGYYEPGHCSFVTKDTSVISHPYKPGKNISDCIYVAEG